MKSIKGIALGIVMILTQQLIAQPSTPVLERVRNAQSKGKPYLTNQLFTRLGNPDPGMQKVLSRGSVLGIDASIIHELKSGRPSYVALQLPYEDGQVLTVDLVQNEVLDGEFKVTTSAQVSETFEKQNALHYQGIVRGSARSVAAISIVDNEVMGVIDVDGLGNLVLGKLENDAHNRHILYRTEDLNHDMQVGCDADEVSLPVIEQASEQISLMSTGDPSKCVKIYFECEYDMFVSRSSSVQSTVDFMTGIYNVVKTLYDNESVNTAISEIFVWTTPDSYPTTSTADALYAFRSLRGTSFNGNLAHLVSRGAPSSGGVAFLDAACSKGNAYAYSYITSSYSTFPTYSWTVNVIAHEMGHNLGSSHTHGCVWDVNGDGTANEMIDGCGPNRGYTEGSCTTAPLPTNGGTVMSYCHLVSGVGINWNNGFGQLPGDRIRNRVYNGTCFSSCFTCATTVSISKTDVTCAGGNNGSATATGSGSTGTYTYSWSNGAKTATVTGLTAGTYSVTVRGENGAGCPVTVYVTISQPVGITPSAAITHASVPGASNGSIDLSVSGGSTPYSYQWNNGSTAQDIVDIPGGQYSVTIHDQKGCNTSANYTVNSNGCGSQLSVFPVNESFESGPGIFSQSTSDNYDWTRQTGTTPNNRTGPSGAYAGSWYMFAQGKNNTGDAALVTPCLDLTQLNSPSIKFAYSMNGNTIGTLRVEVSTNNGSSWTSLWSRSGNQGTNWYTATVSLDNYKTAYTRVRFVATAGGSTGDIAIDGVEITGTGTVDPCTAPTLSFTKQNVSCNGGNNGSATVSTSGGTSPFTILWSNGATSSTISNLSAGSYSVTVTATGGCSTTGQVSITQPSAITIQAQTQSASGESIADGSINISVSGGTSPFTYQWSNGATTEDLTGVPAGIYTVNVTDAASCATQASFEVTEPVSEKCADVITLPYQESFESGLGAWQQSTEDVFNWRRNSGGTPTSNSGPASAFDGSFYMYTLSADASGGSKAILESTCIDLSTASQPNISFAWHMEGKNMGNLSLFVSNNGGLTWTSLWGRSGHAGSSWFTQNVSLSNYAGQMIRLRFVSTLGNGPRTDMAIDNIRIQSTAGMLITERENPTFELKRIYPNPTRGQIQVEIFSPTATMARMSLVDVMGRSSDLGAVSLNQGENNIRVNVPAHEQGIYMLRIQQNGQSYTKPVMVIK